MFDLRYESEWNGSNNDFYLISGINNVCTPHFHKNIEIFYNLWGNKQIIINSRPYTLKENQLAISLAYDIHQYINTDGESCQLVLIIPDNYSVSFYNKLKSTKLLSNIIDDNDYRILKFIEQLKQEKEKDKPNNLVIEGLMQCILGIIFEKCIQLQTTNNDKNKNFMKDVFEYIENNYIYEISLDSIANNFGYSKFYFSRLFTNSFNININEYIAIIRMSHTITYMQQNKCSVTEAALANGFGSVKTFYKYKKKLNQNQLVKN